MPRSWNIKRLLKLDTKNEDVKKQDAINKEKAESSAPKKQKGKPPEIPECRNKLSFEEVKDSQLESSSRTIGGYTSDSLSSSTATDYSPSYQSGTSSSASESLVKKGDPPRLVWRSVDSGKAKTNSISTATKQNCSGDDSPLKISLNTYLVEDDTVTPSVVKSPISTQSETKVCADISDYVENAILETSTSPSRSHLSPRLTSFESSPVFNHDKISKSSADTIETTESDLRAHYVSLDFVRSAAAEGHIQRRNKETEPYPAGSSGSSRRSSLISSVGSEEGDIVSKDFAENLFKKITAAADRHKQKNSRFPHPEIGNTGDIEKDLLPVLFPGRRKNERDDKIGSNLIHVEQTPPPRKEYTPADKVDDFLERNFNDNNRKTAESSQYDDYKSDKQAGDLGSSKTDRVLDTLEKCKQCFGYILSSDDISEEAMNKAKGFFGQCLCSGGERIDSVYEMDFCSSSLKEVPEEIFAYAHTLTKLSLESNTIADMPRELFICQNLRHLSVSDNHISTLPTSLASLTNLTHLDVSKNEIENVPESIRYCKNLEWLDASVNPIEKLSEGFTQLVSLKELYMNDCCLDFLPATFGRMSQLCVLELRDNHLQILPKSIRRLPNLTRLDLGGNAFQDWPDVISKLTNLTELWFDFNELNKVPSDIGILSRLTYLDLSRNLLESIPGQIGALEGLTDLLLSENSLISIPDSIGFLRRLQMLSVDTNQLRKLPESFGKLQSLEEVDLSHNQLEFLPSSIGNLKNLHTLLLDENQLSRIPEELGECHEINILQLSRNQIGFLPASIGDLANLRVLNISQNRIPYLPVTMLKLSKLDALWVSANQSKPNVPLQVEFHPTDDCRVLTNILFPQDGLSRVKKVLGNTKERDAESYAIDAADDDDLEAYANRKRGKIRVFFNLDATTYRDDIKRVDTKSYDEGMEQSSFTGNFEKEVVVDLTYKKEEFMFDSSEVADVTSEIQARKEDATGDAYSVDVHRLTKPSGLPVLSESTNNNETSRFSNEKPVMKMASILTVKMKRSEKAGNDEMDAVVMDSEENVASPLQPATWSSDSDLPSVLPNEAKEAYFGVDKEYTLEISTDVANKNKSVLKLPDVKPKKTEVNRFSETTCSVRQLQRKFEANSNSNGTDMAKRAITQSSDANNFTNLLMPLNKGGNDDAAPEKRKAIASSKVAATAAEEFQGSLIAASANSDLDKLQPPPPVMVEKPTRHKGFTAETLSDVVVPAFVSIPFMDSNEEATNSPESLSEDVRNPAESTGLTDRHIKSRGEKASVKVKNTSCAVGNECIDTDSKAKDEPALSSVQSTLNSKEVRLQHDNFLLSPEYITEGKSPSVTSGDSIPATDLDSGVGNDVESQSSNPDLHEEANDLEMKISATPKLVAAIPVKEDFEVKAQDNVKGLATRRNTDCWPDGVKLYHKLKSEPLRRKYDPTSFEETKISATSFSRNVSVSSVSSHSNNLSNVSSNATTVTYSRDYKASRGRNDATTSGQRIADNIAKFEKFFENSLSVAVAADGNEKVRNTSQYNMQTTATSLPVTTTVSSTKPIAIATILPSTRSYKPPTAPRPNIPEKASDLFTKTRFFPDVEAKSNNDATENNKKEESDVELVPTRSSCAPSRKSKFEEALAATKHKHFRDKLEKMMQQQSTTPRSSTRKLSSRSSVSSIASTPRITSPVSHHSPSLERMTADNTEDKQKNASLQTTRISSIHSRLKEKLQQRGSTEVPVSDSSSNSSFDQERSVSSRPAGRRGSAQRILARARTETMLQEKFDAAGDRPTKSLEEQLGKLLLDGSASSGNDERGFVPYKSEDPLNSSYQGSNTLTSRESKTSTSNTNTLRNVTRKTVRPDDWKVQLLQYLDRKRQEAGELPTVHTLGSSHPRISSPEWKNHALSPVHSPNRGNMLVTVTSRQSEHFQAPVVVDSRNPSEYGHRGVRPKVLSKGSNISNSVSIFKQPLQTRECRQTLVSSSQEKSTNFTRNSSTGPAKQPGVRRSSGRYQRTRTPGPESFASERETPNMVSRPKSAMDTPLTHMPDFFPPQMHNQSINEMAQVQSPTSVSCAGALPSYEDHILHRSNTASNMEDYKDYVSFEYVNHLLATKRAHNSESKFQNSPSLVKTQAANQKTARRTMSEDSVRNLRFEKSFSYDTSSPVGMPASNSHDSLLEKAHHNSYGYHRQDAAFHADVNTQLSYLGHNNETAGRGYSRQEQPYPVQHHNERLDYAVIPALPGKTSRPPSRPPHYQPIGRSMEDHREDPYRHHQLLHPSLPDHRGYSSTLDYHDDYVDAVHPTPPPLHQSYAEREVESFASAFRPYQHQHNNNPSPNTPAQSHWYDATFQSHYARNRGYTERPTNVNSEHYSRHHHVDATIEDSYSLGYEQTQTLENDPSLIAEGVEQVTVTVRKKQTFGFHIMGGTDAGGNPYRHDDDGVFITYVAPGGAGEGRVQPGDKILLVNGSDFVGITHRRAVDLLRNAGQIALLVVERSVGQPV